MGKFRFWATIVTAFVLGLVGLLLAGSLPLPNWNLDQTRIFYALIGILIGLSAFAPISTWVVRTSTRLVGHAVSRLAMEIINQFTKASSRGWPFLPIPVGGREVSGGLSLPGNGEETSHVGGAIILDTSSIIDGRILDVAKTGFLMGVVLVPNFVLTELQQVADSADSLKRSRGRRGFTIIDSLKKIPGIKIQVWDKDLAGKSVDDKLVRLGKIVHGRILTCDFNLSRVAQISGVRALNLNDLGNALKTLPVPGEMLQVKIIHPGKDKDQGVGYCLDGAMVIVKDGADLIGQELQVEVTKILQAPSGRIIFGRKVEQ